MVIQSAPFYNDADRLDNLGEQFGIDAVVRVNPNWDGLPWIVNAVRPSAALTETLSDLRPRAAALKAQLDADAPPEYVISNEGQMKPDLSGFATVSEAVSWAAAWRVITRRGSVWGDPDAGTELLDLLSQPLSEATLAEAVNIAIAAISVDDWYSGAESADIAEAVVLDLQARLAV